MNGEEFRLKVIERLTKTNTLLEQTIKENSESHLRMETILNKVWERVIEVGVVVSLIAVTVGVVI